LVIGLIAANLVIFLRDLTDWSEAVAKALMYGLPLVLCLAVVRRPLRFALSVGCVLVASALALGYQERTLRVERSFFGVNRVTLDPAGRFHWLTHGNTIHGVQSLDPRQRGEPLGYFTRTGPFGQAFGALEPMMKQRVGVIGLGAGSLACYAARGERWTYYEIDPVVERIARDPRYFTFLQDCPADVDVILGDARLSLQKADDGQFGTLVLDAYNSDTVPLHLITREALALYLRKLAPDGALIFHISNRHLRLERVLGVLAQDAGLTCLAKAERSTGFTSTGKLSSKWVVMARHPATLGRLMYDPSWLQPPPHLKTGLWTDDYASVFSVFDWR
jgi:SAM-dependent methyltransferase